MSDRHDRDDDHAREHDRPLSGPALRAKALEHRVDEWDVAARSTPHGKPIELPRRG